jgi:nitrogen fixation protein NifQ
MMNKHQRIDTGCNNSNSVGMENNEDFMHSKAVVSTSPLSSLNTEFLQTIIDSQRQGLGCLPHYLGLEKNKFSQVLNILMRNDREGLSASDLNNYADKLLADRSVLRQQLLDLRTDEVAELSALLVEYRAGVQDTELWMADIVSAACMGSDHLWRDLGLPDRKVLNRLLRYNFPALFLENTGDMKWKKFLYKKLCEMGGDYVCRSPNCEECVSYDECFGSEEY